MKFDDLQVDMLVHDHVGNEYKVVGLESDCAGYPVRLQCTKLVHPVSVDVSVGFKQVGDLLWIHGNREYILNASTFSVQQVLSGLGFKQPTRDSLTIRVSVDDNITHDFYIYPESEYHKIELTCDELVLMYNTLTVADLHVGMKLTNATNNTYVLVGFDDKYAHLAYMEARIPCRGASVSSMRPVRQQLVDGKLLGYVPVKD